jgi:hypothetical protein
MRKASNLCPSSLLLVALIALWLGIPLVNAQSSSIPPWEALQDQREEQKPPQQVCIIINNPIRRVEKDNVTGELFFLDVELELNSSSVPKNVTRGRYLRSLSCRICVFTDDANETQVDAVSADQVDNLILLRECTCGQQEVRFFCPARMNTCAADPGQDVPVCYSTSPAKEAGFILWFIVVTWVVASIVVMCVTKQGRAVLQFFVRSIYPKFNVFLANSMLREDPEQANAMIRHYMTRRQSAMHLYQYDLRRLTNGGAIAPETESRKPSSLQLKTCTYHSQQGDDDFEKNNEDDDEPDECTICFGPLEEGDRVGSLPCQHVFHADCLKVWLKSRNVCPLCLTENIATPCFE